MKIKYEQEVDLDALLKPQRGKKRPIVFARFPNCEQCVVTGVLTSEKLVLMPGGRIPDILMTHNYASENHCSFYDQVARDLETQLYKKTGLVYNHRSPIIAILKVFTESIRTLSGAVVENEAKFQEVFYPIDLLMENPSLEKVIQISTGNQIEKEFPIGAKVVIAQKGKFDGHTGVIQELLQGGPKGI